MINFQIENNKKLQHNILLFFLLLLCQPVIVATGFQRSRWMYR